MNLATMLPAITDLSAALGLSATPDESAEMLTIVLGLSLILAGGGIVAACVDGFVAADRTADRAGQSEPAADAAASRSAMIHSLTLKGK